MINTIALLFSVFLPLAETPGRRQPITITQAAISHDTDTTVVSSDSKSEDKTGIDRSALIEFAQTLKGTRYKYASSDPKKGFDCSGFVMYVFNNFQINVPRSSIGFTNIGKEVDLHCAMPGDVILFTGTNANIRKVGHVGIITQACDSLVFIHASSGKTYSVTETKLNPHYKKRFIKVVRLLE